MSGKDRVCKTSWMYKYNERHNKNDYSHNDCNVRFFMAFIDFDKL